MNRRLLPLYTHILIVESLQSVLPSFPRARTGTAYRVPGLRSWIVTGPLNLAIAISVQVPVGVWSSSTATYCRSHEAILRYEVGSQTFSSPDRSPCATFGFRGRSNG